MNRYISVDRLKLILETANPKVLDVKNLTWDEIKEKRLTVILYAKVNIPGSSFTYYVDINSGDKFSKFMEMIKEIKEEC